MPTEFRCPLCRSAIAADDVNVATDIALCRACGKTSAFSVVSGVAEVSLDALHKPPPSIRLNRDPRGARTLVYRRASPILWFLVPFAAFWSGGSMWGIYGRQLAKGQFDLTQSLFGIPFVIGTVILLGVIAYLAFGRWQINLRGGAGTVFTGVGPFGWTRRFSYNRQSVVSLRSTNVSRNDVPLKGVLVRTNDTDFVFGALMNEDARRFIAASIMQATTEV
jgi:hypothetical protein